MNRKNCFLQADFATEKVVVENNYLSNQQRSDRDKEFDACKGSVSCQLQVGAKWDAISLGQDTAYSAGMLVGVPQGLYDSVESLSKSISDPAAAYDAIKQLIASDDIFGTMSVAVKQSYIDRINLMESEYQKAGASGAYNAGVEAGKLVSDLIGAVAGDVGVAKVGTALTEKIAAKVVGKVESPIIKGTPETTGSTSSSGKLSGPTENWKNYTYSEAVAQTSASGQLVNADEDPLAEVEIIYADFDYPSEIEGFIKYMPPSDGYDPSKHSQMENINHLMDKWKNYLEKESAIFKR